MVQKKYDENAYYIVKLKTPVNLNGRILSPINEHTLLGKIAAKLDQEAVEDAKIKQ